MLGFCLALIVTPILGCREVPDDRSMPYRGTAILQSESRWENEAIWSARVTTRALRGVSYVAIVLEHGDGQKLEILRRKPFPVGTLVKADDGHGFVLAMLSGGDAGYMYMADAGSVSIVESGASVRGSLSLEMVNSLSSCMGCPGTRIEVKGDFHASRGTATSDY